MKNQDEPKKVDPLEVFEVLGTSDEAKPAELQKTAQEVGASPEVVKFMETLPPAVKEPSDVVEAAADPEHNAAGVELELPEDENEVKPELTIEDVTEGDGHGQKQNAADPRGLWRP